MTNVKNYEIKNGLYLICQSLDRTIETKPLRAPVEVPTNHIVVIDCSGSMAGDLPKIREQLKNKLPKLLKADDTISIIWFSGRGQCGVLLEGEKVASLTDLQTVNAAIDRWLRPIGLTGFKEPLELVDRVVGNISNKWSNGVFSLFFMSDGCDNQWPRQEIMKAVERAGVNMKAVSIVEYGYYADRPLLTAMAEKCGGSLIFAEDFDRYAPSFEASMQRRPTPGVKKIQVDVPGDPIGGFAFALKDDELLTFSIEGGKAVVPSDVTELYSVSPVRSGDGLMTIIGSAEYAALALYAQRMNSNVVYDILRDLGDVRFINLFGGCFGKQKYSEFVEEAKKAAFSSTHRFTEGMNQAAVPKEDAFTVIDLLATLAGDEDNKILLDSKDFRYSKISRARIDSNSVLTDEEQDEVRALTEEMGKTRDAAKISELSAKISAITNKPKPLEFVAEEKKDGYEVASLTYNEERANVSFLVKKFGTVNIAERMNAAPVGTFEKPINGMAFPTFIWRNYAVIKDGLVNIDRLPVRLTAGTIRTLKEHGMPTEVIVGMAGETDEAARKRASKASSDRLVTVVFNLRALPIINRKMVSEMSAEKLFEIEWDLTQAKAAQKVYNSYKKEKFPRKSEGFAEKYGPAAADWLKEQGITDYSGFSPKQVQAAAKDFYMGKVMEVSIKGYGSLPSLKDVLAGKGGKGATLMKPHVEDVEKVIKSGVKDLEYWIDSQQKLWTHYTRQLISLKSRYAFTAIVGQTWFKEFKSLDENTLTFGKNKLEGVVELKEERIDL